MLQKVKERSRQLTSVQLIVLFYLTAIIIATTLLSLPAAHKPGVEWHFIDGLFTAVSAISVTGLSVFSVADTFSVIGVFLLAFVLQIGGIGIMALGTFIWVILGKRIGLKERQLIMTDHNRTTLSGLVNLMLQIFRLILAIEAFGAFVLGTYFTKYFDTWQEAYLQGFFASVSATTNAGFDITGASLVPFANDYFVQFIIMILIVLGSIGFPVLIELKEFLTHSGSEIPYRFSLFTKLTSMTFLVLTVLGVVVILLLEFSFFFQDKAWHETFFYALFQSITTKSGGLSTVDVNEFTSATQLFLSGMMFIGASPSGVGGGIRTTTFAIVVLTIFFFAKGNSAVKIFGREIHEADIMKAFVVTSVAILLCGTSVIILSVTETASLIAIIFEVSSAFGTTGLSMGITPTLSAPGKIVIMILMFIGRIGLLSFLFIIRGNTSADKYHYPKERVIIG
ncbi:TrkH family potassium uptake protein [Bacillus taeanensis]|uniref:TrkH family potassium uptake protein n=1 Tax=Bacillus taeanensis TaxID=273032 RepID=A0A366XUV6_9BACI|nr:TrkH family potassium uptake protein [Bacillus taeanensis]RBW69358.1 TrkH family potassium uptake protein [Bacillus taeanensis]